MQLRLQHQKSGSSALDTRVAGVSFDGRQVGYSANATAIRHCKAWGHQAAAVKMLCGMCLL
jgi:hypothetical protein